MSDLLRRVEEIINKYKMIENGDKIVAGISGGPDSMCMLHILIRLRDKYDLSIFATHLNHQFRGEEANNDAIYVKDICKKWNIPFFLKSFDVSDYARKVGLSDEEAGRDIRYKLYEEVLNKTKSTKIAVAHNLNDHIETVFINLIRGSGVEGLKGIEPVRDNIIRPLIGIDRRDIEDYCEVYKIFPRIDKTNLEPIYGRNKIRLGLIPYIKENLNPSIMDAIGRLSDIASFENDYMDKESQKAFICAGQHYKNSVKYSIIKLDKLHLALKRRIIRIGLEKLVGDLKGIGYKHIDEIISIIKYSTGAAVMLPKNVIAYISYGELILKLGDNEKVQKFCYKLKNSTQNIIDPLNIVVCLENISINKIVSFNQCKDEAYIDGGKVNGHLFLRNRFDGDVFSPIGMKGTKKLKDFFIDEKIPRECRDSIQLIADEKEIIWVVGKRLSEKYKVTEDTKDIIRIKIKEVYE